MNEKRIVDLKYCVCIIGGIAMIFIGGKLVYMAGCRQGVSVSKWFINRYEPEAYQRLCRVIDDFEKSES